MPSANEAVALAVLETMRRSVVLSKIRAFKQVVTDGVNGYLVPVGDVKALAAAIVDAWEHCEPLGATAIETRAGRRCG